MTVISGIAKTTILASTLAICAPAVAQVDLSNPASPFANIPKNKNWIGEVNRTERGHILGNPDADAKMIEFVSYTCSVCLIFAQEGEPAIDLTLLMPGDMSVEVRPMIRNYLDLTVSMLVACGDPKTFKVRHRDFMWSQPIWLGKANAAPASQRAIWERADKAARVNLAAALDLDDKLIARGASAGEVNKCLTDDTLAQSLIDNSNADRTEFGVRSTPSFALDGKLLPDVHQWATLYPILSDRFAPKATANALGSGGE